jgi:formylglycine-generating enzyme required for sulfatase activity
LTIDPLASAKHVAVQSQAVESGTDSQFHLPPPSTRRQFKPERTRWNMTIAIAAAVVVLIMAGVGVFLAVRKNQEVAPHANPDVALDKEYKNNFDMNFVLIPAGSFEMGSTEVEDEGPVHSVEITRSFYLGTTEVTLRQYRAVMGQWPREFALLHKSKSKESDDELDRPVTSVAYAEARAFCIKLNTESGKKEGWEYRLPTEAQWEYACRAGTATRFHTGNDLTRGKALFGDSTLKTPGKVGQFAANAWGLFDMHGNVAEWVNDRYDDRFYANSPVKDPCFDDKGRARSVVRGGGYDDPKESCRSAKRRNEYGDSVKSFPSVGFRVAIVQVVK